MCTYKWVSLVILITQWKKKKMHCIFSKWNKCVFIFHEWVIGENVIIQYITTLLLLRTFPLLTFISKCVVKYCAWVHVGWNCSRMLAPCDSFISWKIGFTSSIVYLRVNACQLSKYSLGGSKLKLISSSMKS